MLLGRGYFLPGREPTGYNLSLERGQVEQKHTRKMRPTAYPSIIGLKHLGTILFVNAANALTHFIWGMTSLFFLFVPEAFCHLCLNIEPIFSKSLRSFPLDLNARLSSTMLCHGAWWDVAFFHHVEHLYGGICLLYLFTYLFRLYPFICHLFVSIYHIQFELHW